MTERRPNCLSDLALEKLVAADGWEGPLGEPERTHLRECDRCARRLAEARSLEAEFADQVLPSTVAVVRAEFATLEAGTGTEAARGGDIGRYPGESGMLQRPKPLTPVSKRSLTELLRLPDWRRVVLFGAAAAACCLVLLIVRPTGNGPPVPGSSGPEDSYVGQRGAATMVVHVKRGDRVMPYEPGTALHPGDRLRIVPVAPERKHLLLLLRDAGGRVQILYPWAGSTSGPLPPPGEALPGSFGLDAVLGDEVLVGLASDAPVEAAPIAAWFERSADSLSPASAAPVTGADLVLVRYTKVKP
ncbi:MAG: hypothetical protein FJ109_19750 [Deltaproteobacteria bacterium]|nr:hypothetical protein [Deltaproteobacteria bacterium]